MGKMSGFAAPMVRQVHRNPQIAYPELAEERDRGTADYQGLLPLLTGGKTGLAYKIQIFVLTPHCSLSIKKLHFVIDKPLCE
jgi:hypothetical protein